MTSAIRTPAKNRVLIGLIESNQSVACRFYEDCGREFVGKPEIVGTVFIYENDGWRYPLLPKEVK